MNVRTVTAAMLCGLLLGCGKGNVQSDKGRFQLAMDRLQAAESPQMKFHALGDAAKASFIAGKTDDARKYAEELLTMLPDFQPDLTYGRAFHDGNMVLGRIAVRDGRMEDAKKYLLQAGQTPGGPYLDNYGPDLSLAKDLLDKGEKQAVLDYFDLCAKFWKNDGGRLARWKQEITAGKKPDFGPNLTF